VAAVYVDPAQMRCAYCGMTMEAFAEAPKMQGMMRSMQMRCSNDGCSAFHVMGDVPISTLAATRHERRRVGQ
jgi:hypothetical protein